MTRRFNAAQLAFISRLNDADAPWMKVREHRGLAAAQDLVDALGTGRVDPNLGHVVVLD